MKNHHSREMMEKNINISNLKTALLTFNLN